MLKKIATNHFESHSYFCHKSWGQNNNKKIYIFIKKSIFLFVSINNIEFQYLTIPVVFKFIVFHKL